MLWRIEIPCPDLEYIGLSLALSTAIHCLPLHVTQHPCDSHVKPLEVWMDPLLTQKLKTSLNSILIRAGHSSLFYDSPVWYFHLLSEKCHALWFCFLSLWKFMKPLSCWNMELGVTQICVPRAWSLIFGSKINAYPLLDDYCIFELRKIKLKTHTGDWYERDSL